MCSLVLCNLNSPFPGASVIISTSFLPTGMSRLMRASLCSRSSHRTPRSAPRCTTSLTMHSSLVALSQGSFLSPHGTLPPISITSRLSSHKRISLACDKHVTLMKRSCQIRPRIASPPRQARVARPVVSHSSSASSRRQCSPAALSLHSSARRASRSWLGLPVALPFAVSQRCCVSYRLRRRLRVLMVIHPVLLQTRKKIVPSDTHCPLGHRPSSAHVHG